MKPRIAVVGATGYAGSELCRWLLEHPSLELGAAISRGHAGRPLGEVVPALSGCTDLVCSGFDDAALEGFDAVAFALPHGETAPLAARLSRPVLLDLASDHRHVAGWTYGLVDWHAEAVARSRRIAVPGCFATAIALSVAPFAALGAIAGRVCVAASTGSTGSGATPSAGTHHPERFANFKAYKVLTHQHVPEIRAELASLGQPVELSFVPTSAPLDRGIFATSFVPLRPGTDPVAAVRAAYRDRPLLRLRADTPEVRHVRGTAFCDLAVHADGDLAVVLAAIDNLGKGAASQAVQCLNLVFDLPVQTGLVRAACAP